MFLKSKPIEVSAKNAFWMYVFNSFFKLVFRLFYKVFFCERQNLNNTAVFISLGSLKD